MSVTLRVLLIEDNDDDAHLIVRELKRNGYEVTHRQVKTTAALREALSTQQWDLILSDYNLITFDGMEALQIYKEHGLDIPFIMVTGTVGDMLAASLMKGGAHDYIMKDNFTRLVPSIRRELGEAQKRRDLKLAEAAKRAAEEKYQTIFANAAEGIFQTTPDGHFITANPALARILGYDSPKELIASVTDIPHQVFVDPSRRDGMAHLLRQHDQVTDFEYQARRKDSSIVWLSENSRAVRDADGKPLYYEGMVQDITARKKAEEALRRNEALLLQTGKMARVGGWDLDVQTMALLWSLETYHIHEVDPSLKPDLESAINFYAPEARPIITEAVRRATEEGTAFDLELPFITARGKSIWVRAMGQSEFRDGKCVRLFGAFQDITDRKLAEEQILKQLTTISTLYAITQKMTRKMDLSSLVKDATRICVESFEARLAWLGVAEDDGRITVLAAHGRGAAISNYQFRWDGQGDNGHIAAEAIKTSFPVIVHDVFNDPRTTYLRSWAEQRHFTSFANFPLIIRGQPFGVLGLWCDQENFFNEDRMGFLTSYSHQVAAALENARLFAETERRLQNVQALHAIDMVITSSFDLNLTLGEVLTQVMKGLNVDAAWVLQLPPQSVMLEYLAGRGFNTTLIKRTSLSLGESLAGRVVLDRKTLVIADLTTTISDPELMSLARQEKFTSCCSTPLIAKGRVLGVLQVFQRSTLNPPTAEWLEFFETLAGQTAIALDNSNLFSNLQRSNAELSLAYNTTLEGWSRAMDLRDKETEGHTQRVTEMTLRLADAAGLSDEQTIHIWRGGLLHDMGKLGVPDSILLKPGNLTDEEWVIMKKHPQYAYDMLYPIPYLRPALDIPYCHHEKWDGTGYPRGLKGEQIPLAARLFAIADVYDALSNDRPYRPAWEKEKVMDFIKSQSGTHFEPSVVEMFMRVLSEA